MLVSRLAASRSEADIDGGRAAAAPAAVGLSSDDAIAIWRTGSRIDDALV